MPHPFENPPPSLVDAGSFLVNDFEKQYEQLFAEALEEGEITPEERQRLNLAASALGLDPERVMRLESALLAAYEGRAAITLVDRADPSALARSAEPSDPAQAALDEEFDDRPTPVAITPARPLDSNDALHERFLACGRRGDVDAQACTAAVLVQRGAATLDEQRLFEKFRSLTPPRPLRALTADGWARLFHPDEDRTTGEIFAVIASAALLGRVSAIRREGTLRVPSRDEMQDPHTSTVSVVRALAWAAATLGLRTPPIYVAPEEQNGFEFVTSVPPGLRVGAPMLRGQSAVQLAFHGARHLSWFREEHFVCTLVPSLPHLEDLFLAALSIGAPRLDLRPEVRARIALVAEAIVPVLDPPRMQRLEQQVARFVAQGGRTSLKLWAQAAEWTALRAGLLLCGDLTVASAIAREGQRGEERVRELERFWASEDAPALRAQLGIGVGG